jgi:hypothetical protein
MFGINVTLYAGVLSRWNSPNEAYSQKQRGPIGQRTTAALATDNSGNNNEAISPVMPFAAKASLLRTLPERSALTNLVPLPVACNLYCADH